MNISGVAFFGDVREFVAGTFTYQQMAAATRTLQSTLSMLVVSFLQEKCIQNTAYSVYMQYCVSALPSIALCDAHNNFVVLLYG